MLYLFKEGYRESTIIGRVKLLKVLAKRGAYLLDPESVKHTIAMQSWSEARKQNAVYAYQCFVQLKGLTWEPPTYKRIRRLPFIP